MQVVEPQGDWRGVQIVAVDLTNSAERELQLMLRIFDAAHDWSHEDRFNLPLVIPPQTRTTCGSRWPRWSPRRQGAIDGHGPDRQRHALRPQAAAAARVRYPVRIWLE